MRILCTSAGLGAHLDWGGYLATAAELARRGHVVVWASGPGVRAEVEAAGLAFAAIEETGFRWPLPPPLRREDAPSPAAFEQERRRRALDQWLEIERVARAAAALERVIAGLQPDLLISEMFVAAAGLCAERAGLPLVVAGWPAHAPGADSDESRAARARLAVLCARTGVRGEFFAPQGPPALLSPRLHISYWSPSWFAGATLLAQTQHVGGRAAPALPPDPMLPAPDDRPWVLVTLGTTFHRDDAFFVGAAQAAVALGCVPVLATGPLAADALARLRERLPARAVLRERVDFAAVLPYTAAAIHHGGAGTTHALVTHAVPQVVVPHAGDQARQALGVQRAGVGAALPPQEVSTERLTTVLARLLPDRAPERAAALRLRDEFAALGGVARAAELVEAAGTA